MRRNIYARKKRIQARKSYASKKRTTLRRKLRIGKAITPVQMPNGFPRMLKITHTYNELVQRNPSTALQNYFFKCNGMYDPNTTGTGHQPYFYDQMLALYNHYTVIGSRINVKCIAKDAANVPAIWGVVIDDDSSTSLATADAMVEYSKAHKKGYRLVPNYAPNTSQINLRWSAKKTFGGSVLSNPNLQGASGADPSEISSYRIWCASLNGTDAVNLYFDVTVEYIAVWKELRELAQS